MKPQTPKLCVECRHSQFNWWGIEPQCTCMRHSKRVQRIDVVTGYDASYDTQTLDARKERRGIGTAPTCGPDGVFFSPIPTFFQRLFRLKT